MERIKWDSSNWSKIRANDSRQKQLIMRPTHLAASFVLLFTLSSSNSSSSMSAAPLMLSDVKPAVKFPSHDVGQSFNFNFCHHFPFRTTYVSALLFWMCPKLPDWKKGSEKQGKSIKALKKRALEAEEEDTINRFGSNVIYGFRLEQGRFEARKK